MASITATATKDVVLNKHNFIEEGHPINLILSWDDKKIPIITSVEKVIKDDNLIYTLIFKGDYPFSTESRIPLNDPTDFNKIDFLISEKILEYLQMDYANAKKKKKKKVDEIISRTKQTVSIKDNNLLMINPKKMDEIISDFTNSGDRNKSFTMPFEDIRIKCNWIGLIPQFDLMIMRGWLTVDQAELFRNDEEKSHMLLLMSVIPSIYEEIDNKDICQSYIEYLTNRCEYTPLGININYYDNKPDEITGKFDI